MIIFTVITTWLLCAVPLKALYNIMIIIRQSGMLIFYQINTVLNHMASSSNKQPLSLTKKNNVCKTK